MAQCGWVRIVSVASPLVMTLVIVTLTMTTLCSGHVVPQRVSYHPNVPPQRVSYHPVWPRRASYHPPQQERNCLSEIFQAVTDKLFGVNQFFRQMAQGVFGPRPPPRPPVVIMPAPVDAAVNLAGNSNGEEVISGVISESPLQVITAPNLATAMTPTTATSESPTTIRTTATTESSTPKDTFTFFSENESSPTKKQSPTIVNLFVVDKSFFGEKTAPIFGKDEVFPSTVPDNIEDDQSFLFKIRTNPGKKAFSDNLKYLLRLINLIDFANIEIEPAKEIEVESDNIKATEEGNAVDTSSFGRSERLVSPPKPTSSNAFIGSKFEPLFRSEALKKIAAGSGLRSNEHDLYDYDNYVYDSDYHYYDDDNSDL